MNPLHNPYYTPLCKMDEVYGEGTAERLRAAGGPWEWFNGARWRPVLTPNVDFRAESEVIRLAPAIPMTVPWDAIAEGWDWAAINNNCGVVFRSKPMLGSGIWVPYDGDGRSCDHLVGFDRGTVDWRDSLQRRPGK